MCHEGDDDHDHYNALDDNEKPNIHDDSDKDDHARFGGEGPEVAVLDASDLMCPGRYLYEVLRPHVLRSSRIHILMTS